MVEKRSFLLAFIFFTLPLFVFGAFSLEFPFYSNVPLDIQRFASHYLLKSCQSSDGVVISRLVVEQERLEVEKEGQVVASLKVAIEGMKGIDEPESFSGTAVLVLEKGVLEDKLGGALIYVRDARLPEFCQAPGSKARLRLQCGDERLWVELAMDWKSNQVELKIEAAKGAAPSFPEKGDWYRGLYQVLSPPAFRYRIETRPLVYRLEYRPAETALGWELELIHLYKKALKSEKKEKLYCIAKKEGGVEG